MVVKVHIECNVLVSAPHTYRCLWQSFVNEGCCFHFADPISRCDLSQGKSNILVSTDVAARGLHINRLQYVVNYDFPLNLEQYCHRVGRTGRQGKEGQAYSLLSRSLSMLAADLVKLLEVSVCIFLCGWFAFCSCKRS
jgi:hypothetical protein